MKSNLSTSKDGPLLYILNKKKKNIYILLKYSEWHVVVSDNFVNKSSLIKKILRHNIKLNTRRLFFIS